jgi:hypothetical protein
MTFKGVLEPEWRVGSELEGCDLSVRKARGPSRTGPGLERALVHPAAMRGQQRTAESGVIWCMWMVVARRSRCNRSRCN